MSTNPYRRPKTIDSAAAAAAALLRRALPGKRSGVAVHIKRAESIATTIFERFEIVPAEWQAKHARWYLSEHCKNLSASTQYDHWCTVRNLAKVLGKFSNWESHLNGSWCYRDGVKKENIGSGGRPTKL